MMHKLATDNIIKLPHTPKIKQNKDTEKGIAIKI